MSANTRARNASTRAPYSYVWTGEYEIFEFDLGSTFNYAEMAGLIAPRPFMVERGHKDGVAPDEWVGYEYAKVKRLYDTFSPQRLMWGTDWPIVEAHCGYAKALAMVRDEMKFLNENDKSWMLSRTVERVWKWS